MYENTLSDVRDTRLSNTSENVKGESSTQKKSFKVEKVSSPITGKVVALRDVKDPMFAQGMLGAGVAIDPSEGKIYSPFNGKVSVLCQTKHAIGLVSEEGAEVFIHIGMDTVNLGGKYFKPYVKQEDIVSEGELLVEFDIKGIRAEGYNLITPIIVANTQDYASIASLVSGTVKAKEALLELK